MTLTVETVKPAIQRVADALFVLEEKYPKDVLVAILHGRLAECLAPLAAEMGVDVGTITPDGGTNKPPPSAA